MSARTNRRIIPACLLCLASPATAFPNAPDPEPAAATLQDPWAAAGSPAPEADAGAEARVTAATAELPMCFEQNVGQTDEHVAFLARGSGVGVFLTPDELVLSLRRSAPAEPADLEREPIGVARLEKRATPLPPSVVRMRLAGANLATPVGEQQLRTTTNYFLGDDPDRWRAGVPTFARVRYPDVYPGVDLVYYGRGGRLEYDFVVAAGADPNAITIEWEGAESVEVDASGALVLRVEGGELRQRPPALYQTAGSGRSAVAGAFAPLGGGRVGLRLGAYDPSRPLVIDPVLEYATFLGGGSDEFGSGVAVDGDGAAYVAGFTASTDFPARYDYDSTFNGGVSDAFVTKLSPAGDEVIYSTFLGGRDYDEAFAIAVDAEGSAFVAGYSFSADYPTDHAYDATYNGGLCDAVVTKLSAKGDRLVYSTYLGGTAEDFGCGVAVDPDGIAYVVGTTGSSGFPTTAGAYDTAFDAAWDVFVAKLKPAEDPPPGQPPLLLEYSTFVGGSSQETGVGVAVDAAGAAHITGWTHSSNFPTAKAFDASINGSWDAYVAKLSAGGNQLVYSTFLGGSGDDSGVSIALDASGAAYVAGATASSDFPTRKAYDRTFNGGSRDAFVAKLELPPPLAKLQLTYSTFLGGSGADSGGGVAVDASGAAYVTGSTGSVGFPTLAAFDASLDGVYDAFVTKLTAGGNALIYSTFLGGEDRDYCNGIAVDASGAAYVTGLTRSAHFPTQHAYDDSLNGVADAFVAKLE